MKFQRYCNPGKNWSKCMASRYGCSEGYIDALTDKHLTPLPDDNEACYQGVLAIMRQLKTDGYKQIKEHCEICGPTDDG